MIHFLCRIFQCAQIGSDAGTNVLVPGVVQKFHRSCLKVKKFLIAVLEDELAPIRARRKELEKDIRAVYAVLAEGSEKARKKAAATLEAMKAAMKINYFQDEELIAEQVKRFTSEA